MAMWRSVLRSVVRLNFSVDALSFVYALYVYLAKWNNSHDYGRLLWLCAAKYHGFAAHCSLLLCYSVVCQSLRSFCVQRRVRPLVERLARVFGRTDELPSRAHWIYAARYVVSSTIHALVHVFVTHRWSEVAWSEVVQSGNWWSSYRWTIGGYAMCVANVVLAATGSRLILFAARHSVVRTLHVFFVHAIFVVLCMHSSNYPLLACQTILVVFDLTYSLSVSCHVVDVQRLSVYQFEKTTVIEIDFEASSLSRSGYRYGDHVRVYVPVVSLTETHSFTVVPHVNRRQCFRLIVRVVGRWTRRLYDERKRVKKILLFGPYGDGSGFLIDELFPTVSRPIVVLHGVSVDETLSLCLICTGSSVTFNLALLTFYSRAYERLSGRRCSSDELPNVVVVPARIKLVWLLATSFELNYAVRHLNAVQGSLERCGWHAVLTYELYVSRSTSNTVEDNRTIQEFLVVDEIYDYAATTFPPSDRLAIADGSLKWYEGENDYVSVCRSVVRSYSPRSNRTTTTVFPSFHSSRNELHSGGGSRVKDWARILASGSRSQSVVAVVLTTGVKALREQIRDEIRELNRRNVSDDDEGRVEYRLFAQGLW